MIFINLVQGPPLNQEWTWPKEFVLTRKISHLGHSIHN
jgi:hypothetical protein